MNGSYESAKKRTMVKIAIARHLNINLFSLIWCCRAFASHRFSCNVAQLYSYVHCATVHPDANGKVDIDGDGATHEHTMYHSLLDAPSI